MDHEEESLLEAALTGDTSGLERLLEEYRGRLRRMISLRLDPRLRGRVDGSDVIQDAYLDVMQGLEQYMARRELPFFLWVRYITGMKLHAVHRKHLDVQKRDARREVRFRARVPEASSIGLAGAIADDGPSPSQQAIRAEELEALGEALEELKPIDREILALRHVEQLTNAEAAQVLDVSQNAASLRYMKAARRLGDIMEEWARSRPGGDR